jgi:ribose-phosphate pyrophosphokinase
MCERIKALKLNNVVIVSPDVGFAKQARRYASCLGVSIAIADKERVAHDEKAEVLQIIGSVKDQTVVVVDDFLTSGGTLASVSEKLIERGATEVYAAVTHGVLTSGSIERIDRSPIKKLFITDTVENQPVQFSEKIEIISVAPLFAEAIKRIHNRESISEMFRY